MSAYSKHIIFCDLDGTLLHDSLPGSNLIEIVHGHRLEASRFMHEGVKIRIERIVASGALFVLCTGRRLLTYRPVAAALQHTCGVIENGGLIIQNHITDEIDRAWWAMHERTLGSFGARDSLLWQYSDILAADGFQIGDHGRYASFRVMPTGDIKTVEQLYRIITEHIRLSGYESDFCCLVSEGCVDVIPSTSGKLNAAKYLVKKYGGQLCVHAVGDSQSDYELLGYAQHAYCPASAIPELKHLVRQRGGYISPFSDQQSGIDILEKLSRSLGLPDATAG